MKTQSNTELLAAISKNQNLIDNTQRAATGAFQAALAIRHAPAHRLQPEWAAFLARTRNVPRSDGNLNSLADQTNKAESLRVAQETVQHFTAEATRLRGLSEEERYAEQKRDDLARTIDRSNRESMGNLVANLSLLKMSPIEFVNRLHQRGIVLVASGDGGLLARPRSLLTPADLDLLKQYKAQIVEHLADTAVVA